MVRKKAFKVTFLILFGILLPLVLLEAVLQGAAYWKFRQAVALEDAGPAARGGRGERVVLCVGDSFTFGSGCSASDKSYPAQLQVCLNEGTQEGGRPWKVYNRGWPGRNSGELMQRIPGFLIEVDPDWVVVLIGKNDTWSTAEMDLPPPSSEGGGPEGTTWQWKCRTLRLFHIFLERLSPGKPTAQEAEQPSPESREIPAIAPEAAVGGSSPAKGAEARREAPPEYAALLKAKRLFRDNDVNGARRIVDEVRPAIHSLNDQPTASLFLDLIQSLKYHEEVLDECRYDIEKYGKRPEFLMYMISPLIRLGRLDEALQWTEECLRSMPGAPCAAIHRSRAVIFRMKGDMGSALREAFLAFSVDRNKALLEDDIRKTPLADRSPVDDLPALLDSMALDPPLSKEILEIVGRVVKERREGMQEAGERPMLPKLREHLGQIIAMARHRGVRVLLLTYPNPTMRVPEISEAARSVAAQAQAPLEDLSPVFSELVEQGSLADYFIPDGHCNDAGYRIMAERIGKLLVSLSKN